MTVGGMSIAFVVVLSVLAIILIGLICGIVKVSKDIKKEKAKNKDMVNAEKQLETDNVKSEDTVVEPVEEVAPVEVKDETVEESVEVEAEDVANNEEVEDVLPLENDLDMKLESLEEEIQADEPVFEEEILVPSDEPVKSDFSEPVAQSNPFIHEMVPISEQEDEHKKVELMDYEKPVFSTEKPVEEKVEEKVQEEKVVETKVVEKPAKTAPVKKVEKPAEKSVEKPVVAGEMYVLSYDKEDKLWAIKKNTNVRATKKYKTKKEALEELKVLAENAGIPYVVQKMDGTFQNL